MEVEGLVTIAGYIVVGAGIIIALAIMYCYNSDRGDE